MRRARIETRSFLGRPAKLVWQDIFTTLDIFTLHMAMFLIQTAQIIAAVSKWNDNSFQFRHDNSSSFFDSTNNHSIIPFDPTVFDSASSVGWVVPRPYPNDLPPGSDGISWWISLGPYLLVKSIELHEMLGKTRAK